MTELGTQLRAELEPLVLHHREEFRPTDWGGACGVAAYAMYRLLRRLKLDATFVLAGGQFPGSNHCYTESEGYIIDLTATQFGHSRLVQVVTRPSEWHLPRLSQGRKALARVKQWDGQSPYAHLASINAAVARVIRSVAEPAPQ